MKIDQCLAEIDNYNFLKLFRKKIRFFSKDEFGREVTKVFEKNLVKSQIFLSNFLKIVSREVHVPKSCPARIFEPFLKSCPSKVRVL